MTGRMNVTTETFIRDLPLTTMRRLVGCLDRELPTCMDWRGMAARLPRQPGGQELKYNTQQISIFGLAFQRPAGSPTESVLQDWGTTNARVSDLLQVFLQMRHFAAMDALLPGSSADYMREEQENGDNDDPPPPDPSAPPLSPTLPPNIPPRPEAAAYPPDMLPNFDPQTVQRFSYEEVTRMTRGFDARKVKDGGCFIDEGGFGVVFRGQFSGQESCAVKKIKRDVMLEELVDREEQFDSELKALCKLRHPNLVILYGYCYEPPNLCLVYEFITGGSLRDRLAFTEGKTVHLSWPKRLDIAWGSACGVQFLHERGFIHRDIKSANILLDTNLCPKLCDLGLVRDKSNKQKGETSCYRTTLTIGSTAYMAPEAHQGEYSKKTDVYSFGLVLLEVLTGYPVYEETHIMERVEDLMEVHHDVLILVDKHATMSDEKSAKEMYDLAIRCTKRRAKHRPDITEVVERLVGVLAVIPSR